MWTVPQIFLGIFSQEASPTICDSLFELIPNISLRIFYGKASPKIDEGHSI